MNKKNKIPSFSCDRCGRKYCENDHGVSGELSISGNIVEGDGKRYTKIADIPISGHYNLCVDCIEELGVWIRPKEH